MDQLRRSLAVIQKQLGRLTGTQKWLIGCLVVVIAMTLFLVSQYAGGAKMTELLAGATPAEVSAAETYLKSAGVSCKRVGSKIMVPAEEHLSALALLGEAGKLPSDASITFKNYIEKQNWMNPRSTNDQIFNTALQNTLGESLRRFRGIESASVVIDAPEARGLGSTVKKPTAAVFVLTKGGRPLERTQVDAIAAYVASAKSGLEPTQVAISDGARKYSVRGEEDFQASTYLEHAAKCEEAVQAKIASHLSYIPGVSIAVTAIVDVRKTTSLTKTVKPKGQGSEAMVSKDSSTTSNQTQPGGGAEPGLGSNVALDINRGGGGAGTSVNDEKGETEYSTRFGTEETQTTDPRGMPTKINATIGVPRDYVVMLAQQKAAPGAASAAGGAVPAAPSQKEIDDAFAVEKARLEADISPLIETDGKAAPGEAPKVGSVVVSMIPVPMPGAGPAGPAAPPGGSSAGVFGGLGTLAQSGILKQAVLGGMAVTAMAMMLLMVRKTGRSAAMPTAEEIVGIPPALATGSDLVGEAEEGDTAMVGIEIDDASLKTKKMLEEVADMVKKSPADAGALFTRWISTDS